MRPSLAKTPSGWKMLGGRRICLDDGAQAFLAAFPAARCGS